MTILRWREAVDASLAAAAAVRPARRRSSGGARPRATGPCPRRTRATLAPGPRRQRRPRRVARVAVRSSARSLPDEEHLVPSPRRPRLEARRRRATVRSTSPRRSTPTRAIASRTRAASCTSSTAGGTTLLLGADDGAARVRRRQARLRARRRRGRSATTTTSSPLDLTPGDHTWSSRSTSTRARGASARACSTRSSSRREAPRGCCRGRRRTTPRALAARMSSVSLDRRMAPGRLPACARRPLPGGRAARREARRPRALARASGERRRRSSTSTRARSRPTTAPSHELSVALPLVAGDEVEDDDWTLHVDVAGREVDLPFHPRKAVREAMERADRALAKQAGRERAAPARPAGGASWRRGDGDVDAQLDDARELDELAAPLDDGQDPWAGRTGPMRRAYRSPADGKLAEFALYVPPDFDPEQEVPAHRRAARDERAPARDAHVALRPRRPDARRQLGGPPPAPRSRAPRGHRRRARTGTSTRCTATSARSDVMRVVDWAMAHYPIDESRVTITGPSMGGIGTAACALHHPDRFAAAEPLCGYHSYFVRGDIGGARMRPVGALHRRAAVERDVGRERPLHPDVRRARHEGPARGEQRGPHRPLRRAPLRDEARAPRARAQRLADDVRGPQGRALAALAPAAAAPARAALQDAEHALGRRRVGARAARWPRAISGARSSRASTRTTASTCRRAASRTSRSTATRSASTTPRP